VPVSRARKKVEQAEQLWGSGGVRAKLSAQWARSAPVRAAKGEDGAGILATGAAGGGATRLTVARGVLERRESRLRVGAAA
jgi:hypothetical protein